MTTRAQLRRAKTISFDADGTLWDFDKVMRRSLAIALSELRRRVPGGRTEALTVDRMIAIRDGVAAELDGTGATMEETRLRAFARTVEYAGGGDETLAHELLALYLHHRFGDI